MHVMEADIADQFRCEFEFVTIVRSFDLKINDLEQTVSGNKSILDILLFAPSNEAAGPVK
jgi:hypothetical protein